MPLSSSWELRGTMAGEKADSWNGYRPFLGCHGVKPALLCGLPTPSPQPSAPCREALNNLVLVPVGASVLLIPAFVINPVLHGMQEKNSAYCPVVLENSCLGCGRPRSN